MPCYRSLAYKTGYVYKCMFVNNTKITQVWGVVCDNASNNAAMMDRLKRFNLKRLDGPAARVHCLPHVLNLAAKARPQSV
jgi:hypothetical protein